VKRMRTAYAPRASFGAAPNAAWQWLRTVIPWQADSRPEVPAGELAYAFIVANPASTFMGGEQDPAVEVRAATSRALKKLKVRRAAVNCGCGGRDRTS
jgi:hypothetical protein